jgi:hypothetical protein
MNPISNSPTATTAGGQCLCGGITFSVALPSLWVAHCHCRLCQKNSGAAFVTWAGFDETLCHIQDINSKLHWYQSSDEAQRGFCKCCGTVLFFRSRRWPNELHITLSNFETHIDAVPQMHVFWETHVDWVSLNDDLPKKCSGDVL